MSVTAKLFTHGGSQAVRLPKAFRFEGREVRISRDGDRVILEPAQRAPVDWDAVFARMDALAPDEPFPERLPQPSVAELAERVRALLEDDLPSGHERLHKRGARVGGG